MEKAARSQFGTTPDNLHVAETRGAFSRDDTLFLRYNLFIIVGGHFTLWKTLHFQRASFARCIMRADVIIIIWPDTHNKGT